MKRFFKPVRIRLDGTRCGACPPRRDSAGFSLPEDAPLFIAIEYQPKSRDMFRTLIRCAQHVPATDWLAGRDDKQAPGPVTQR